jgi:hypothetical protein
MNRRADHQIFQQAVMEDGMELFAFESDFVATLRCIPMAVRFKLDLAGIKVTLRQWSRFNLADRSDLLELPCGTPEQIQVYRQRLVDLIALRTDEPAKDIPVDAAPPWNDGEAVPAAVTDFAGLVNVTPPSLPQWAALSPLRRFTLVKLTRDSHDNENFVPAMAEFGLLRA